jgi:hypothetical protein
VQAAGKMLCVFYACSLSSLAFEIYPDAELHAPCKERSASLRRRHPLQWLRSPHPTEVVALPANDKKIIHAACETVAAHII